MKIRSFFKHFFTKSDEEGDPGSTNVSEKLTMIQGIEELSETIVKEVMVPRVDVESVNVDIDKESLFAIIKKQGFSRYPVYNKTIDNVVGILYVKDILKALETEPFSVKEIMRKPYFVPDSKRLDALLKEFKRRKIHIAVAVDEYGGISGIISLEDILELIVGDIQDEFDDEKDDIVKINEGIYICDARTTIDELNETLNVKLPDEDFETLGGFLFELFGKIPENLEKISYENLDFIVQSIDGHKINSVKLVINQ